MRIILSLLACTLAASPLSAQTAPTAYDQGVAARRAGDNGRAIVLLEQAVREVPDSADAHVQLGYALLAQGRLDAADLAFGDALWLAPLMNDVCIGQAHRAERRGAVGCACVLVVCVVRRMTTPRSAGVGCGPCAGEWCCSVVSDGRAASPGSW